MTDRLTPEYSLAHPLSQKSAEVRRLRELLAQAEVDTERKVDAQLRAEIERLTAENQRLREELTQARDCCARPPGVCFHAEALPDARRRP